MSLGVLSSSTPSIADTRLNDRTSSAPPRRQRKSTNGDSLLMSDTTELHFPLPLAKDVSGRAPPHIKQSVLDALAVYGVGQKGFASAAGKAIQVRNLDLENYGAENGGISVVTAKAMSEVVVNEDMLNGFNILHGGCVAYIIDLCASLPLAMLGLIHKTNGVGVTQSLNVLYHAPATLGSTLEIISSSLSFGTRSMSAKCEIVDKSTGRLVASAFVNKMAQPTCKL